jgi:hypothetical protein
MFIQDSTNIGTKERAKTDWQSHREINKSLEKF